MDIAERVVRIAGIGCLVVAWATAARGAVTGERLRPGRATGLAKRYRAHVAYLAGAIPYFTLCALLWRPIPVNPGIAARIALLIGGTVVGGAGAMLYLWGRRELGPMYNVSSSLGSELYDDHRLVVSGPYARVRHPMYAGLALAAIGGALVYRTWTLVFMLAALCGAAIKARSEERLLAAEFGERWNRYASAVPCCIPRPGGRSIDLEVNDVNAYTGA